MLVLEFAVSPLPYYKTLVKPEFGSMAMKKHDFLHSLQQAFQENQTWNMVTRWLLFRDV